MRHQRDREGHRGKGLSLTGTGIRPEGLGHSLLCKLGPKQYTGPGAGAEYHGAAVVGLGSSPAAEGGKRGKYKRYDCGPQKSQGGAPSH